jgi:hypothetical protein
LPRQSPQSGVEEISLKHPRPHTLSLKHQSVDAEPRSPSSVCWLDVGWRGQEESNWWVSFHVKSTNRDTSSASREMLGHPSTETEWTMYIQLPRNAYPSSSGAE